MQSNPVLGRQVCTWGDCGWASHLYPDLRFNPVPEHREPRVHAGFVPLRAALAPAHHAGLKHPPIRLRAGQGASGVALAGVHATAEVAHANHAWGDLLRQQVLASRLVDDPDLALLQDHSSLACLLRVAPASDPDGLAGGEGVVGRGQADGPDGGAVLHRPVQLQQRNVVVEGEVVEKRVLDDPLQPTLLHPRGVALALVMQAQEGRPHAVLRVPESSVVDKAVCGGYHPAGGDERGPAQVALAQGVEAHLPGPLALVRILTSDDPGLPGE